jgi:MoxR-like ATPase
MKNIQESFENIRGISEYIKTDAQINEGLKDWLKAVKDKFKKAWQYLKGIVVKLGTYFLPVDTNGEIMPAISPLTAGSAYNEGLINTDSTCVVLDKNGAKITGCTTKHEDALKLYGSGDSRQYWGKILEEGDQKQEIATIIENYMKDLAERRPDLLEETEKSRYIKSELEKINEVKLQNSDPEAKYNIIVDDDKLKNRIKMTLKNKKLARLMIWGAPGIGKSAILMKIIDEMRSEFPDYSLITKTLSSDTPDNFTLPTYVETEGGRKAEDVPKTWLPVYKPTGDPVKDAQLDEACGKGLLFIDELSRATPQVLNVILPLVNEGIFNGYNLGSGWTIVVASNRAEDEMSGQSNIGNALANRFAQVYYEPSVHTWRKWADKQHYISPLLLQWLSLPESENMSGAKYYYMDPNEDLDSGDPTKLMCTPRAWSNAMRILAEYSHTGSLEGFTIFDIDRDIIASALNECIPAQAIDSFLAFLDVIQKIGDFDRAVEAVWKNDGKGFSIAKKDLNKVTLPVAQLVCTSHNTSLPTEKEFVSLANWLTSCDSDQLASYVLDIFKSTFINTKNVQLSTANTDAFFIAKLRIEKLKAAGKNNEAKLVENMYKQVCDNWGISINEIPNYYPGLQIITKKYGDSFKSAVVGDHIDALG